jgi:hypothetical protein
MTRQLEDLTGLSISEAKILEDIRKHSWHVMRVIRSEDEKGPEWAFSIGLFHSFVL